VTFPANDKARIDPGRQKQKSRFELRKEPCATLAFRRYRSQANSSLKASNPASHRDDEGLEEIAAALRRSTSILR
jgi:hypothetical protein